MTPLSDRDNRFEGARQVVSRAVAARVFPGAVVNVGSGTRTLWHEAFGALTFDGAPVAKSTAFDLASLTKVVATTTVVMGHVGTGRLLLDGLVSAHLPEWRGADRDSVTIQDLLEHASGLPARLVDAPPASRREFEHEICTLALEYPPRSRSIYSDLGFILLGLIVEDLAGRALSDQFQEIRHGLAAAEPELRVEPLTFELSGAARSQAAPTRAEPDDVRRGRTLIGEVHDCYAAALGGVAGHAGLFGTAAGVAAFGRVVLRAARGEADVAPLWPSLVQHFFTRSIVPGSSRGLGWDTMLPTSSCGTRMSSAAVGHAGYTGTSLWLDPLRDRYFVLLSNRSCGGGSLETMRDVRRAFHDSLADL